MDYLLIPDSGFAISIFSLAIMISGLAIMILFLAQGIFLKKQGETDNVQFCLNLPLAFTRYLLIHRHFDNQVKSMNGNDLIVAFIILYSLRKRSVTRCSVIK